MSTIRSLVVLMITLVCSTVLADAPDRGTIYLSSIGGAISRVDYDYDGVNPPRLAPVVLIGTVPRGGGIVFRPGNELYVVGAGSVSRFALASAQSSTVSSTTNANTATLDPLQQRLWVGWKDAPLAEVPLAPLANGMARPTTGDDGVITTIAFTPADGVFYTTGGEFELGNFGRIDLATFVTTRLVASLPATSVNYDAFSDTLILAGVGRATQRTPNAPGAVLSSRDDTAQGENYLSLTPTGRGHLISTRFGATARLIFIDYAAASRIGDASTRIFSLPVPGIADLSGQAAFDTDSIMRDGFETNVP